jgi:3-isopropylmalate dehydratase small subunit
VRKKAQPTFAEDRNRIAAISIENTGCQLVVDLEQCVIVLPDGAAVAFSISPSQRHALPEGVDEIQLTLHYVNDIGRYEAGDASVRPWVHVSIIVAFETNLHNRFIPEGDLINRTFAWQ